MANASERVKVKTWPFDYRTSNGTEVISGGRQSKVYLFDRNTIKGGSVNLISGGSIGGTDSNGDGVSIVEKNGSVYRHICNNKSNGFYAYRLGKVSGIATFYFGDLPSSLSGSFSNTRTSAFCKNVVGVQFMHNVAEINTTENNNAKTEGRILDIAGVYVDGSDSTNNGNIKNVNFTRKVSGSTDLGADGFDKNTQRMFGYTCSEADANTILTNKYSLIGLVIRINFNVHLSKTQAPTVLLWDAQPICVRESNHTGSTSSSSLHQVALDINTTWQTINPSATNNTRKAVKLQHHD